MKWGTPEGIADAADLLLDQLRKKAEGQIVLADIKLNQLYIGEGWYHQTASTPRMIYKLAKMGKIIFLRRRNLVRSVISALRAEQSGVWHDWKGSTLPPVKLKVNADQLLRQVIAMDRGLVAADGWLSGDPKTVLRVHYEDLFDAKTLACNRQAFDKIATFAGLKAGIEWHSPLSKIGTQPLRDIIENFDEVREKLLPTKYASMLSN